MNQYMRRKLLLQQQPNEHSLTVQFLSECIKSQDIDFKFFMTLSYYSPVYTMCDIVKEQKHIKNVILKYFYNNIPKDRMRLWFFMERHSSLAYHSHILIEGIDDIIRNRFGYDSTVNSNIILHTTDKMDSVILDGLERHMKKYVKRLGTGGDAVDIRDIGDIEKRLGYVNKEMRNGIRDIAQEGRTEKGLWDHIDIQNSDMAG